MRKSSFALCIISLHPAQSYAQFHQFSSIMTVVQNAAQARKLGNVYPRKRNISCRRHEVTNQAKSVLSVMSTSLLV